MKKLLALSFALTSFAGLGAASAGCPVHFGNPDYLDRVAGKIKGARTCAAGARIASDCALGSSGDSMIAGTAFLKCQNTFAGKLTPAAQRTYTGRVAGCERKYAGKQGTMYISFAAFCRLEVAQKQAAASAPGK